MKKILLCGLKYDLNFGDPIINDSCKYIVQELTSTKDVEIEEIDMTGRCDYSKKYNVNKIVLNFNRVIKKTLSLLKKIKIFPNYMDYLSWYFTDEYMINKKYYKNKIKNADLIIFVGGGIVKYKYQNFYHYINYITKVANKYEIPVGLNAVGVEGFDNKNKKCRVLKKALNRKCVKMLTTRDDLENLYNYISKDSTIIHGQVSDSAVFIKDVYDIKRDIASEVVGLGVCRGNLFIDNDINYNEKHLLDLWANIIKKLDERNIKWKIYTNGSKSDNEFAYKLISKLQLEENNIILPTTPQELVKTIAGFKAIINTRLHSSIIAYSLKVPSIGLVWNKKIKMFGESIGYPDRFLNVNEFDSTTIVNKLEKAITENYEKILPEEYRKSVKEKLEEFINNNI